MNLLVVENDVAALSQTVELIKSWGYCAEKSETGRATLSKLKEKAFDLVLLDMSLPDMKPQALITRLKEIQPDIGIITLTGANTKELENEIRTLGIIYYMSKPINDRELKEILDHSKRKKSEKLKSG